MHEGNWCEALVGGSTDHGSRSLTDGGGGGESDFNANGRGLHSLTSELNFRTFRTHLTH